MVKRLLGILLLASMFLTVAPLGGNADIIGKGDLLFFLDGGLSLPLGKLIGVESDSYSMDIDYGSVIKKAYPKHLGFSYALSAQYLVKDKLGLQIKYAQEFIDQSMIVEGSYEDPERGGILFSYRKIDFGVAHYFIRNNEFAVYLSGSVGFIFDGFLTAYISKYLYDVIDSPTTTFFGASLGTELRLVSTRGSFLWGFAISADYNLISLADKVYVELERVLGFCKLEAKIFIGYKL